MKLKAWFIRQLKKRTRVYIVPTKMGSYLNGLIFLMFLLSVGYSNNLLLIFTLFLFSFNVIWIIQTHFHLQALKLNRLQVESGHVGDKIALTVRWGRLPALPGNWEIQLLGPKGVHIPVRSLEETNDVTLGDISLPHRGLWSWDSLRVGTSRPFGLYYAWIYFPIKNESLAYPELLKNMAGINLQDSGQIGDVPSERKGDEDIKELAPYQGEESRKISWKHYARSGELFVKEGEDLHSPTLNLKIRPPEEGSAKELYLSQVATQLVYCHRNQVPFFYDSVFMKKGPAHHQKHLQECLKDLTLC